MVNLGIENRLFVIENHDQAYQIWCDLRVRDHILVHIDAHHDMWWIPKGATVTIANFISAAVRNGLLRKVFWVAPDLTWTTKRDRKQIIRHLEVILRQYPEPKSVLQVNDSYISIEICGKILTVCSLDSLPVIEEKVLLDIDIDFLIIPRVASNSFGQHGAVPWCWPSELLARLSARGLSTDIVTIAYSVNGGYTPLKWKYLGDELALRLRTSLDDGNNIEGMELMRQAALAAASGNSAVAEIKFKRAADLLVWSAAPIYHLAHLSLESGHIMEARESYRQALALDPSYGNIFCDAGLQCYWDGQFGQAERASQIMVQLDPDNAEAHYGLGLLAKRRGNWSQAEALLRKVVELEPKFLDGYRALGDVFARQRRPEDAISAYMQALRLALGGYRTRRATIVTHSDDFGYLKDPWHFQTYARLAQVYLMKGAFAAAINLCNISIAGGDKDPCVRLRLTYLYLRTAQWMSAVRELNNSIRAVACALLDAGRRLHRDVRPTVRCPKMGLLKSRASSALLSSRGWMGGD
jgi:tetratricopeptide (TPR) repeat protein